MRASPALAVASLIRRAASASPSAYKKKSQLQDYDKGRDNIKPLNCQRISEVGRK